MSLSTLGKAVAVAAGGVALTTLGKAVTDALTKKVSDETLGKAVTMAKASMAAGKADSMISYSQAARVEPILLMDDKAVYVPFIQDVVHTMNSLFTAYYLQSISLDTTLSGVKVLKRLDKFNPDRSLADATRSFFSPESFAHGLPFPGQIVGLEAYGVSFESSDKGKGRKVLSQAEMGDAIARAIQDIRIKDTAQSKTSDIRKDAALQEAKNRQEIQDSLDTPERREERMMIDAEIRSKIEAKYPKDTPEKRLEKALQDAEIRQLVEEQYAKAPTSSIATKDMTKMVTDVTNLAVGKVIEVSISENDQTARIPVTIRMRVTSMPSAVLAETLAVGGVNVSGRSRWKAWRAGELRFWGDIILAQDRIDAHREAIRKDQSGYYAAVHNRANKNLAAEIMGSGPSVGTASSIIVLTEQTKKDLERRIGGRLSDYKTRESIFINTYSMLMCVVDPEWETVTIYHRGIEMPTELSAKYIQNSNKGQGPDVAEILKAYQLGTAPHRL